MPSIRFIKVVTAPNGKKYYRFGLKLSNGKFTHDVLVREGHLGIDKYTKDEAKEVARKELAAKALGSGAIA